MSLVHPVSRSVALLSLLSHALSFETSTLLRLIIATIMGPNNHNSCSNQSAVWQSQLTFLPTSRKE